MSNATKTCLSEFDAHMVGCEEEGSPIRISDGLKKPRVQSTTSGVSLTEDSNEASNALSRAPSRNISASLANQASRAQ